VIRRQRSRVVSTFSVYCSILCASGLCAVAACTTDGQPQSTVENPTAIRQADDQGRKLPFKTLFPNRWSKNNNGTSYEPCTALTNDDLASVGVDPSSAEDVALADHQTARGCLWRYVGNNMGRISQATGNRPSFEENIRDRGWYKISYNLTVGDRLVLVNSRDRFTCMTTVKSAHSPVHTTVIQTSHPPETSKLCARAISFTKLTIPEMPLPIP